MRGWLAKLYLEDAPGWSPMWRRSLDMGASLEPFLARELKTERKEVRRLVLTAAYSLAARRADVVFLGELIRKPTKRERFLALFAHLLGPRQVSGAGRILGESEKSRTALEDVAACLAVSRCADRPALPRRFTERAQDVGVLAAALFCRPDQREDWIERRIKDLRAGAFAHLCWRGYLLGDDTGDLAAEGDRLRLALRVLRRQEGPAVSREAAWYLANSPAAAAELPGGAVVGLTAELRLLLARSRTFRPHILRADGDGRGFRDTDPESVQRRFVVLIVRWAELSRVRKDLAEWQHLPVFAGSAEHRRGLGLAVAWRLLTMSPDDARTARIDTGWLESDPEVRAWLSAARSDAGAARDRELPAEPLAFARQLLLRGQLPRDRAAEILEGELWRNGSHPGLAALDLIRQFQAELLIDGVPGARFARSPRQPYLAAGIQRNEQVFQIARELFTFMRREEPWSMPEYRLAN